MIIWDFCRVHGTPAVAKVAMVGSRGQEELTQEAAVYDSLAEQQGEAIPDLLMAGVLQGGKLLGARNSQSRMQV